MKPVASILITYAPDPTESWWVGCDRAEFDRRVAAESSRMRGGRFAALLTGPSPTDPAWHWETAPYRRFKAQRAHRAA